MTNDIENLRKIKTIEVETAFDGFYRYSLWQFICQDAWELGEGRRNYFGHVRKHVTSPLYKVLDPVSGNKLNIENLTERDIQNFIGKKLSDGPGVHTTVEKLQVLDAYAKIKKPEIAATFRIDAAQEIYADLRAKRFLQRVSGYVLSEIDDFFHSNEGLYILRERPFSSKILTLKHVPKKAYMIAHIFVLNDGEYSTFSTRFSSENFPEHDRYSGALVPTLSGECSIELQHAYSGSTHSLLGWFEGHDGSGSDIVRSIARLVPEPSRRRSTIHIKSNTSIFSGSYSTIEADDSLYFFSRRLFEYFGKRI